MIMISNELLNYITAFCIVEQLSVTKRFILQDVKHFLQDAECSQFPQHKR